MIRLLLVTKLFGLHALHQHPKLALLRLVYGETRSMRPYLGATIKNSLGNLEVPFFTLPAHPIISHSWENMSTNFTSHVMSTPNTLAGQGILGMMHGNIHRYLSTQRVYCGCGCVCGVLIFIICEDFDMT